MRNDEVPRKGRSRSTKTVDTEHPQHATHLESVDLSYSLRQRLQGLVTRQKIAHLWILVSPSIDAATTVARAFLLDWLGAPGSTSVHPDLLELKTSGKIALHSVASVSHMLGQLALAPHGSNGRAILIDAAERMLPPTANALLKALEEPPSRTLIVLTTSSPHLILPTILSRAQVIRLPGKEQPVPIDLSPILDLLRAQPASYASLVSACGVLQKALEKEQVRLEREAVVKNTDWSPEISAAAKQEMASETDGSLTLWSHTTSKQILEQVYLSIRGHTSVDAPKLAQLLLQAMNGIDRGADLSTMLSWFITSSSQASV